MKSINKQAATKAGGYSLAVLLLDMGARMFTAEASNEGKAIGAVLFLLGYGLLYFGVQI